MDVIINREEFSILQAVSRRSQRNIQRKKAGKWRAPHASTMAQAASVVFRVPQMQQELERHPSEAQYSLQDHMDKRSHHSIVERRLR
jgi:hypothetical protein